MGLGDFLERILTDCNMIPPGACIRLISLFDIQRYDTGTAGFRRGGIMQPGASNRNIMYDMSNDIVGVRRSGG